MKNFNNSRQIENKWQEFKTLEEYIQSGNWIRIVYFSGEHESQS